MPLYFDESGDVRTGKGELINRSWSDDASFLYDEQDGFEFQYETVGFAWDAEFCDR